jgi:3',5'-cyclic AMP phosphodiesterase CpdA
MKLAQISDLHFGAEEPELVDALVTSLNQMSPDLIVVTGDLTQYGRRREFDAAARFFERLKAPLVGAPGNHDTPYLNIAARIATPWARYRRALGGHLPEAYKDARVHAVMLDTARGAQTRLDWSLGMVRLRDALKVTQAVAGHDGLRLVAGHHPVVAPGGLKGRANTRGGVKTADLLAASGVDLYLSGHLHQVFAEPLKADDGAVCWFVGAGTALSRRTRGEPASFNVIERDGEGGEDGLLSVMAAGESGTFKRAEAKALEGLFRR